MSGGLGEKVFDTNVSVGDVGIEYTKDGAKVPVNEDTVDKANNAPMPSGMFYKDAAGDYIPVDPSNPLPVAPSVAAPLLASIYVNAATTSITVAGITVGTIAADGKAIQVSSNADDIGVYVNGVLIATALAGAPLNVKVDMAAGDVELRSLVGASITGGTVAINIIG